MTRLRTAGFFPIAAAALFALGGAAYAAAAAPTPDLAKGQALYEECKGCHSLTENIVGPRHCGVMGRHAGSVADFQYSDVMKNSKIVWTDEKLDAFLTSPISYLSGTAMGFAGYFDPQERVDVIAYLKQISDDPSCTAVSAEAKGKH
ncbi:MAG: c-type cytochrome [Rhodospirillaceae bacterium]